MNSQRMPTLEPVVHSYENKSVDQDRHNVSTAVCVNQSWDRSAMTTQRNVLAFTTITTRHRFLCLVTLMNVADYLLSMRMSRPQEYDPTDFTLPDCETRTIPDKEYVAETISVYTGKPKVTPKEPSAPNSEPRELRGGAKHELFVSSSANSTAASSQCFDNDVVPVRKVKRLRDNWVVRFFLCGVDK